METTAIKVSAGELKQKIQNNEDLVLINTLSNDSFCSMHIPGSINIPTNQIIEYVEKILPFKGQHLVVYCRNVFCRKSMRAAELLEALDYKKVSHFVGGLKEWKEAGYKLGAPELMLNHLGKQAKLKLNDSHQTKKCKRVHCRVSKRNANTLESD